MKSTFYTLPRSIWTFLITRYLLPRDLLHLLAVSHACQAFFNSLLPDLAAALDAEAYILLSSVPQETKALVATEQLAQEHVRQSILSQTIAEIDFLQFASYDTPPELAMNIYNVILSLYHEEFKPRGWKEIRTTIRARGFFSRLKEKFASSAVQIVPQSPDYTAPWFDDRTAGRRLSNSFSVLIQMTRTYLALQQSYQSPTMIVWLGIQEKVKRMEVMKGAYQRAAQRMPEEVKTKF